VAGCRKTRVRILRGRRGGTVLLRLNTWHKSKEYKWPRSAARLSIFFDKSEKLATRNSGVNCVCRWTGAHSLCVQVCTTDHVRLPYVLIPYVDGPPRRWRRVSNDSSDGRRPQPLDHWLSNNRRQLLVRNVTLRGFFLTRRLLRLRRETNGCSKANTKHNTLCLKNSHITFNYCMSCLQCSVNRSYNSLSQ